MAKLDIKNIALIGSLKLPEPIAVVSSTSGGSQYSSGGKTYYKWHDSGTIYFSSAGWIKILFVAGGGSGAPMYYGSGGGAGGMVHEFIQVTAGGYGIAVGAAGNNTTGCGKTAYAGSNGANSGASGYSSNGGCGCGQNSSDTIPDNAVIGYQPTSGSGGIGYNGGGYDRTVTSTHSGGGGGLGSNGVDGIGTVIGNGGSGFTNPWASITGSSGTLGGGGGACGNYWFNGSGGYGGSGLGGNGACTSTVAGGGGCLYGSGGSGANNTGSGGGSSGRGGSQGSGGSGIAMIEIGNSP